METEKRICGTQTTKVCVMHVTEIFVMHVTIFKQVFFYKNVMNIYVKTDDKFAMLQGIFRKDIAMTIKRWLRSNR
jgi:hypothetical protein